MGLPQLEIINRFEVVSNPLNNPVLYIKSFDLTNENRYIYSWTIMDSNPVLIKDLSNTSQSGTANLFQMGLGFTD